MGYLRTDPKGKHYDPQIEVVGGNVYVTWQAEINDSGDIYFSNGKYSDNGWEFSRNIKVNDDLTDSFTIPNPVFLGSVLGSVIVSIILVGYLRKYGKREK